MHQFYDSADPARHLRSRDTPFCLPLQVTDSVDFEVGNPNKVISELNSQACTYPCQRFAAPLQVTDA